MTDHHSLWLREHCMTSLIHFESLNRTGHSSRWTRAKDSLWSWLNGGQAMILWQVRNHGKLEIVKEGERKVNWVEGEETVRKSFQKTGNLQVDFKYTRKGRLSCREKERERWKKKEIPEKKKDQKGKRKCVFGLLSLMNQCHHLIGNVPSLLPFHSLSQFHRFQHQEQHPNQGHLLDRNSWMDDHHPWPFVGHGLPVPHCLMTTVTILVTCLINMPSRKGRTILDTTTIWTISAWTTLARTSLVQVLFSRSLYELPNSNCLLFKSSNTN